MFLDHAFKFKMLYSSYSLHEVYLRDTQCIYKTTQLNTVNNFGRISNEVQRRLFLFNKIHLKIFFSILYFELPNKKIQNNNYL